MTRLLLFLSLLVAFVSVMALRNFQNASVDNSRFDFAKIQKEHHEKVETMAHMNAPEEVSQSAEEEVVAVEEEIKIPLDTPELQSGAKIYAQCVVCHGKNANGKQSQKAPSLAGQYNWYLETQLVNMKSKVRVNEVMDPYLKKLSPEDMKNVALYLSKLPWPSK